VKKFVITGICIAAGFFAFTQVEVKIKSDNRTMHNPKYALDYDNHSIPAFPVISGNIDKVGRINELVARKDYNVSKRWQPRQIMGKDFWQLLQNDFRVNDFFIDSDKPELKELEDKPLFRESGILYWNESITVPGSDKVSISAMTPPIFLKLIEKRPNAPFFIMPSSVRPVRGLMKNFEHDKGCCPPV
jgi:hypothetical protein